MPVFRGRTTLVMATLQTAYSSTVRFHRQVIIPSLSTIQNGSALDDETQVLRNKNATRRGHHRCSSVNFLRKSESSRYLTELHPTLIVALPLSVRHTNKCY